MNLKYNQMLKNTIFLIAIVASLSFSYAQNLDDKYLHQVNTLDKTIETFYSVISGEKGEERNWELMQYLYYPEAKLSAIVRNQQGKIGVVYVTPDDYKKNSGPWLVENGFFEIEINRKVDRFGNLAHVYSTYHSFFSKKDDKPFMRGINSIQLMYNGKRWFVVNIFCDQESDKNPIPEAYLPKTN